MFECPLSLVVMKDPVLTPAGHAYEREAIEKHILLNGTDPLTGQTIQCSSLRPDFKLKEVIDHFRSRLETRK